MLLSELAAPLELHGMHAETGNPAKESEKRKVVLSKLLCEYKDWLAERTNQQATRGSPCVATHPLVFSFILNGSFTLREA